MSRTGAALRLVAFGLVCAVALGGVYWSAVRTVRGQVVDGRSLQGAALVDALGSRTVERVLDVVSATSLLAAVGVVLGIALLRLRRAVGVAAIVLLLGANATTQLLKRVVLPRPYLGVGEASAALANSLPSGHVTAVFSVVVALVIVLPRAVRGAAATAGVAATLAIGVATMAAGWHRASDAVAACLVVGAWAAAALVGVVLLRSPTAAGTTAAGPTADVPADVPAAGRAGTDGPVARDEPPDRPLAPRGTRGLGVLAAALLAPGGLVAGVLLLSGTTSRHPVVLLGAYGAGALLTGGTAAAVLSGVLLLGRTPDADD